ncbi:reverse transcriptase domain-containing protein [Tanacetum coccineum]
MVGDAPAAEGDVDIQGDVDIDGLSRMASVALGPDPTDVPSENVEEREEEEVPLRPHVSAGPSVAADKGKALVPDLEIPAEFLAEDAQARKRFEEEQASERLVQQLQAEDLVQADLPNVSAERAKELDDLMMRMTETDWLNLMMQVGSNPALARELLGADVNEENFIERMTAIKEKKKRALADLRYRALKGKPMKQSEVTQMMRTLVKNQWCAAHNGTITMTAVKAMTKQQLIEEYEYICKRLEKDRLLSAQYNLFRPKPVISEPPSKRQRVDRVSSQPAFVPAATTHTADDPDSAGGGTSHPAGSTFGAPVSDSTVPTPAAMDSAGSHHESGVSPFADSADSSSPPNVSTDHIPLDVLFESTSGGINDFFLTSDADEQIGMSRVAVDPDSDDEVLAEILFRGKYISGAGVVVVDKLPDDEIVDPRVKVETVSDSASSPPRSRRKHLGVRSDDFLWDKPVEDFFSSESESDDDMENYIPPLPRTDGKSSLVILDKVATYVYREELLSLCRREIWQLYPMSSVSAGLNEGKNTCSYMSCGTFYPYYSCYTAFVTDVTPRLTSSTSILVRMLLVMVSVFRSVSQAGAYGKSYGVVLESTPMVCFVWMWKMTSPHEELASPEQTATGKDVSSPLYGCDGLPKTVRVFQFTPDLRSEKLDWFLLHQDDTSFDSAVHRKDPYEDFPSLTPFEGGDFILEEIKACLTNDSIPPGIDDADFDPEGDLLLLEKLLNDDPSSPLPPKELHFEELKTIKSSIDDPPELELKDLPSHLEYAFLEGTDKLPVIISKELKDEEKAALLKVLKSHKQAIAWKISDIKGIDPSFCTHKILMEDDFKPAIQHQRRVNPKIHEVIKKEVIKLLDAGLIYPISDSPWVSPVHCVPKKGGMTVVENEDNELIPTRLVTGWRVCIDYRKLNDATRKDHFPLPFMDQMLERLAGNEYYCFLDGFSGYFQIPIDPKDQDKTTFTCPYGTFAYRRMPFGLCNAPGTFQRCMMAIFHDMIEETMECKYDHSALKYLLAKQDAKPRFLRWILLLQEFNVIIRDKKGAENLMADHLSRLKNPHQSDLEKKEITETFPLETLGMVTFRGDTSTPWFADIANYHARNFIVKGMSS